MRKTLTAAASAVAIAGVTMLGAPAASAGIGAGSDSGILNGNNIAVQVPVNVCGNQVNVIAVPVLNAVTGVCNAKAGADQGDVLGIVTGHHHDGGY